MGSILIEAMGQRLFHKPLESWQREDSHLGNDDRYQ